MFLSIGFLQPHKGFDRAVRAFSGLAEHGCRLEIVGSLRVEDFEYVAYVDELRAQAEATPGVTLHDEYVSDAEFDVWIVAADALVLPYRLIWSSGVCERAALYHRPVIASRTGGLADQVTADAVLVDDDDQLADAMRSLVGLVRAPGVPGNWPTTDRDAVMTEIRTRAARRRPTATRVAVGEQVGRRLPLTARTAPLRRLTPLSMPQARSARPGASSLKRVVRRLTAWQVDPIIGQVNRLQQATIDALAAEPVPPDGTGRRVHDSRNPEQSGWIGRIRTVNPRAVAADHVGRRSFSLLRSSSRRLVASVVVAVLVVAGGLVGSAVRAPVAGAATFPLIKVGQADSTYNSYNPGTQHHGGVLVPGRR